MEFDYIIGVFLLQNFGFFFISLYLEYPFFGGIHKYWIQITSDINCFQSFLFYQWLFSSCSFGVFMKGGELKVRILYHLFPYFLICIFLCELSVHMYCQIIS